MNTMCIYIHSYVPFSLRSTMPRGFSNSGNQNVMCIMFKVIIPTQLWGWDEKSEVYMRFGQDFLGKWEYDFGPGEKRLLVYVK